MSVYYVNDHLINEEVANTGIWNDSESFDRIMITTTPMATRKNEDGKFESFTRVICAHNCSKNPVANTRISSVQHEGTRSPRITIRTSSDTRYDSDVFVVALPYDGLIIPFEHDTEALQIFKSMILKSEQFSIEHGDKKYKRVAYFVVRPNYNFIGSDDWYQEESNLKVTFAQSNRTRENQDENSLKWTLRHVTVRFGTNGLYEISEEEETVPYESLNPEDLRKAAICTVVKPTILDDSGNRVRK